VRAGARSTLERDRGTKPRQPESRSPKRFAAGSPSTAGILSGEAPRPGEALYFRVSTEDQDLAGQKRKLGGKAARRDWKVAADYAGKVSGSGKVERKEYEQLHSNAREEI
jgi:hypothetical protein